jgi:hypothetical protein
MNMGQKLPARALAAALAAAFPAAALSQAQLPAPGQWRATLQYTEQTADQLYAGRTRSDLPEDLKQSNFVARLEYGVADPLSVFLVTAYARSRFLDTGPSGPNPGGGESDLGDTQFGVRYRFADAAAGAPVNAAVRATLTVAGDYAVGKLAAIGDGADGVDVALELSRGFNRYFALGAEGGYRVRSSGVSDEWFGGINATVRPAPQFGLRLGYDIVRAKEGLDIGGPGFTPVRFPEVREDYDLVSLAADLRVASTASIGVTLGQKIDGRNTARSQVAGVHLHLSF